MPTATIARGIKMGLHLEYIRGDPPFTAADHIAVNPDLIVLATSLGISDAVEVKP